MPLRLTIPVRDEALDLKKDPIAEWLPKQERRRRIELPQRVCRVEASECHYLPSAVCQCVYDRLIDSAYIYVYIYIYHSKDRLLISG